MNPLEKSTLLMAAIVFASPNPGESSLELDLQVKGNPAPCVVREIYDDYCLSFTSETFLFKKRPFRCYLDRDLVYNCTSEGECTDHGVLSEHTRPSYAANRCNGIPFANIKEKFLGQYVCVIEGGEERWEASFNLNFCDISSLEMRLDYRERPETCITQSEHDGYCLSLWLNGQPAEGKDFQCYLENQMIYSCSADGICNDYGVLTKNTRPKEAASGCTGIPFANIEQNSIGSYKCEIKDDVHLIEASYDVHYCNELNELQLKLLKNNTEVDCFDTKSIEVTGYCLSVGEERDHISQFECLLNGVLVYECLSLHNNCSERGVLQEMMQSSSRSQYNTPREISDTCLGIPFTRMDEKIFGNYSCKVRTGSTTFIEGNYGMNICQNPYENTTHTTNVTEANLDEGTYINKTGSNTDNMYVVMAVLAFVFIVVISIICFMKYFMTLNICDCTMTFTKEKPARSVSSTEIDFSDQENDDLYSVPAHVSSLDHVTSSTTTAHHVTSTSQKEETISLLCQLHDVYRADSVYIDDELEDQMFQDALDTMLPPSPVVLEPPAADDSEVTSSSSMPYDAIAAAMPASPGYKEGQSLGTTENLRYLSESPRQTTHAKSPISSLDKILSSIDRSPEQFLKDYRQHLDNFT